MDPNFDFSYISEGLQNVGKGDSNREEIYSAISEFKNAVKIACSQEFGRVVSFGHSFQDRLQMLFPNNRYKRANAGNVTVFFNACTPGLYSPGLVLFKYELDPIMGYPVTLTYGAKSVQCPNKRALYDTIHDAYNIHVRELRDYCVHNGMIGQTPK